MGIIIILPVIAIFAMGYINLVEEITDKVLQKKYRKLGYIKVERK